MTQGTALKTQEKPNKIEALSTLTIALEKAHNIIKEETVKSMAGLLAKRVFKVFSNLSGETLDPSGKSELPKDVFDPTPRPQQSSLFRFTDQALIKVLTAPRPIPGFNPDTLALQNAAVNELRRRVIARGQEELAKQLGAQLQAGLVTGASKPAAKIIGGSDARHGQALQALEEAGALGQLVATIVFPGWKADP